MSSTSAADARSHAVVPVSISSGVMIASFGERDWKRAGSLRRLDPGTPEVRKTLLALCCVERVFGYTLVTVVMQMWRLCFGRLTREVITNGKKFGRISVVRDHFRDGRRAGCSFADCSALPLGGLPSSPGGGNHVVDGVAHLPIEIARCEVTGRDDACRISRASRSDLRRELNAGAASDGIHDLAYREPASAAQVVNRFQLPLGLESFGSDHVRERQIRDMDIVADRGSVRGWVVVPVDVGHLT